MKFFLALVWRGVSGTRCAVRGEVRVREGGQSSHHDVAAAVQGQVVRAGEGAVALGAAERFDARVFAEMSGELVGAGEAPGAALPGAVVGFLSWGGGDKELGEVTGKEAVRKRWEVFGFWWKQTDRLQFGLNYISQNSQPR